MANHVFCLTQRQASILSGLRIEVYADDRPGKTMLAVFDGNDQLWQGHPTEFDAYIESFHIPEKVVAADTIHIEGDLNMGS